MILNQNRDVEPERPRLPLLSNSGLSHAQLACLAGMRRHPQSPLRLYRRHFPAQHPYGVGWFHHGAHNRSEKGCEAIHLGLVDLDGHTAYTLAIDQTPAQCEDELTLLDFYADHVCTHAKSLLTHDVTHSGGRRLCCG